MKLVYLIIIILFVINFLVAYAELRIRRKRWNSGQQRLTKNLTLIVSKNIDNMEMEEAIDKLITMQAFNDRLHGFDKREETLLRISNIMNKVYKEKEEE